MDRKDFKKLVVEALEDLPEFFKQKLENVEVVVEDEPTPEEAKALGATQREMLLGLYHGVPLLTRTHSYGMVLPDKITIFKKNLERVGRTDEETKKLVVHTVQHELAHHFGISDEKLRELGIY